MLYDGDTFEHDGATFRFRTKWDDTHGAPWDEEDGHGPVSEWTTRAKLPGERVLFEDRSHKRYYDFQEAIKIAKRDGWDAPPYGGTRGQRAARAVEADFERLRRWCADDWGYVGVIVELLDDSGDPMDESESLWGIESDAEDYLEEVAKELAGEILARLKSAA